MTGRKRKMVALTAAAHSLDVNKHENGTELTSKTLIHSQSDETERSRYFTPKNDQHRLGEEFFKQPCITLAKDFLGKDVSCRWKCQECIHDKRQCKCDFLKIVVVWVLVRTCAEGTELRGRIVETEAYLGGEDKASHSAGGKRTERNTAMFMKPGTIYVYPIYGIYLCMNVSSEGEGAAVLLRSLEPLQGQPIMRHLRAARRKEGAPQLKDKELCNGPSKLCQALDIPRCFDRRDLASDPEVWLERDSNSNLVENSDIISAPRVGIESHGEWAKKPWRFYLHGHPCVSVRNKEAEREFLSGKVMNNSDPSDVQSGTGQHNVTGTSQKHD